MLRTKNVTSVGVLTLINFDYIYQGLIPHFLKSAILDSNFLYFNANPLFFMIPSHCKDNFKNFLVLVFFFKPTTFLAEKIKQLTLTFLIFFYEKKYKFIKNTMDKNLVKSCVYITVNHKKWTFLFKYFKLATMLFSTLFKF